MSKVDLRSDTVTKPTPEMLQAMIKAEVGDDVFEEDPTVNAFQEKMAKVFGYEAGLFTSSGVMSNQLAIKIHTSTSEEVIMDEASHVFNYETSATSLVSSVQIKPIKGIKGKLTGDLIRSAKRVGKDWEPVSSLIVIENSTNKGGGAYYTKEELLDVKAAADELGLPVHLDGARLWNAMTASGIEPSFFSSVADTLMVSFSKGLGAPVGSMLFGTKEHIKKARRYRKMLGGGMRQIGLLAAAAEYAYERHYPLLIEDHRRAKAFAEAIQSNPLFKIDADAIATNIVLFDVVGIDVETVLRAFEAEDIHMVAFGPQTIRATFHFQITQEGVDHLLNVTRELTV